MKFLTSLFLFLITSCGLHSFDIVHRNSQQFEACMTMEHNIEIPVSYKMECWYNWLQFYTAGQNDDKIRYAKQRLEYWSNNVERSVCY